MSGKVEDAGGASNAVEDMYGVSVEDALGVSAGEVGGGDGVEDTVRVDVEDMGCDAV